MGAALSGSRWENGIYPRLSEEQQEQVADPNGGAVDNPNNNNDVGGGGSPSSMQMSPLASILPQVYAAKNVSSRVNLHRDTVVFERIDVKPISTTTNVVADNYPIQEVSDSNGDSNGNVVIDISGASSGSGSGSGSESTSTSTTTTTSTSTTTITLDKDDNKTNNVEGTYNIKFKFDTEEPCVIDVHIVGTDTLNNISSQLRLGPFYFQDGLNQQFSLSPSEYINLSNFTQVDLTKCNIDRVQYPVIVTIKTNSYVADEKNEQLPPPTSTSTTTTSTTTTSGSTVVSLEKQQQSNEEIVRSQYTYLTLLACNDQTFAIKPLKQKIVLDHQNYIIHDIYGLENSEDNRECVICLVEPKDVLAIPCRHFCLCSKCAETMRTVSIKCPICRSPIRSLLKMDIKQTPQ
ncbi:hypothetical protein SAMD00019534_100770 [Acytostelium subglobosum LB1]|uniref:hypothetical protein n=1 Tax=Acytostelium subglobosum LB1 TaxID=1410327 RepID=UPI0006451815|nr:hypothetical protein SAMD00019534_100770 [Acytostelium subglobosum LB1]GAM26902.1 hypothetical protein SAMD00019534_100770 [Acytostelium subglobosum LB1]|eukprot:XP_012750170.1 hypothetical protein SAMD00019534_100770 [Acytostelium subglobosum LB1]